MTGPGKLPQLLCSGSLLALLLVGGLVLGLSGCSTLEGHGGRVLRVGVAPNYPPVVFEQEGEIVGIESDLARLVSDSIGRPIAFERYAFPELLDALERGEVDVVMSGLSITPERAERVLFTEPYMRVGQLAMIRSADVGRLGRIQTIRRSGARVGYEGGTTGERYVATQLPRATSFAFENVDEGLRSLRAGRIDYLIHDAPMVWRITGDPSHRDLLGLYQPLTEEYLAWAVRRDDVQLHSLLNATLSHWKREGLIDPILDRWIPVRVTVR